MGQWENPHRKGLHEMGQLRQWLCIRMQIEWLEANNGVLWDAVDARWMHSGIDYAVLTHVS